MERAQHPDEISFAVDLDSGDARLLAEMTLESAGLRERDDLQRWVGERPEIVGPGLLLVTTEFDRWELRERRVLDRLDVLFLDASGSLVVGELKRDEATDTAELQALKYAAYCSSLTVDDVVEEYARHNGVSPDEARDQILEHAPSLEDGELGAVRIRLIAGGFGPAVTSVVLWLRDHDIDIGCVQVTARRQSDSEAVVSARQLIPLPEAEDYFVRRRRREQEEETRRSSRRRVNSITLLNRVGAVKAGDAVRLKIDALTAAWRPHVEALIEQEPLIAEAEWTGSENTQQALRWKQDGQVYSATGLTRKILELADIEPGALPGPDYWQLPSGRSIYEESKIVEQEIEIDAVRDAEER